LQQDGSGAISAPSNWSIEPLLKVDTEALASVRQFAELVDTSDDPHWLVLVGGPGNGKSMAVQEFVRILLARQLMIRDEEGKSIDEMQSSPVPAVLEVRRPDGVLLARIAQDASVVHNPYVQTPSPASDLRELLANCVRDRCHLIACANRGVLESAAALKDTESGVAVDELMQALVATGAEVAADREVRRDINGISLIVRAMDTGSLFDGSSPVFLQLLDLATASEHWEECSACPVAQRCPFFLNRTEMVKEQGRTRIARLCEDGELLDGQPLVFREAGALISLMLAGCSADYQDETPCEWVARSVSEEAWFRLAARRLHMLMFSASAPLGVRRSEDVQVIRNLCEQAGIGAERILDGLPSIRVGLPRFLGDRGIMQQLDPLSAPLEHGLEHWDDGFTGMAGDHVTELEHACQGVWGQLDEALQDPRPNAAAGIAVLARWRSSHSLRYGALHDGLHSWRVELEEFRAAVGIPERPSLRERTHIRRMLREVLDSEDGIRVTAFVRIDSVPGHEVEVSWDASFARRTICITLGSAPGVLAQIPAATFVWLSRRHKAPLHDGTFPVFWLQSAREAIARAASAHMYSRERSGQMLIDHGSGRLVTLMWDSDDVDAEETHNA
jgi:hypothetical protein